MATGVLLVCVGRATGLVDLMTSKDKEYHAVMTLGFETDTEDVTGKVTDTCEFYQLSDEEIINTINSYVGTYMQIPPMYSAIKKDGKKLYEYARAGVLIEREAREVTINSIENIKINLPDITFDVRCSKGTYIRSLCRDIGRSLKSLATLKSLSRLDVNGYTIDDALTLSEVARLKEEGNLDDKVISIEEILKMYDKLTVKDEFVKFLKNGNKLSNKMLEAHPRHKDGELLRVYGENEFLAIYKYMADEKIYKPYKMFLNN